MHKPISDKALEEVRRHDEARKREEMITRNSDNQPTARIVTWGGGFAVQLTTPGAISARDRNWILSPAKAEELASELAHAAKVLRGEAA